MTKTAFAYWNERIAPVFDSARNLCVLETESGTIVRETHETLDAEQPVQRTLRLVELGIDVLVCGAISHNLQGLISAYGIKVAPFVAGDLHLVMNAWFKGELKGEIFAMPGCRGRGRRQNPYRHQSDRQTPRGGRRVRARQRIGTAGESAAIGYQWTCPFCGFSESPEHGSRLPGNRCPRCGTLLVRQDNKL